MQFLFRYTGPSPHVEWVYNPAEIDAAPVIWARDLGKTENEQLARGCQGAILLAFRT